MGGCPWKMALAGNFCSMHSLLLSLGMSAQAKAPQGFVCSQPKQSAAHLIHLTAASTDSGNSISHGMAFPAQHGGSPEEGQPGLKKVWLSRCGLNQSSGPGSVRSPVLCFNPRSVCIIAVNKEIP